MILSPKQTFCWNTVGLCTRAFNISCWNTSSAQPHTISTLPPLLWWFFSRKVLVHQSPGWKYKAQGGVDKFKDWTLITPCCTSPLPFFLYRAYYLLAYWPLRWSFLILSIVNMKCVNDTDFLSFSLFINIIVMVWFPSVFHILNIFLSIKILLSRHS